MPVVNVCVFTSRFLEDFMKYDEEAIYPKAPRVEHILGIVKKVIAVEHKDKKYTSPLLHFMIYVGRSPIDNNLVYRCACLELGKFHILNSGKKELDTVSKEKIDELLRTTSSFVAEYIRLNIFECEGATMENNGIIDDLHSDFMKNFWQVKILYDVQQPSRQVSKTQHTDEEVFNAIDEKSQNSASKRFSFLKIAS